MLSHISSEFSSKPYLTLQLCDLFDALRLQSLGQLVVQRAAGVFLPRFFVFTLQDLKTKNILFVSGSQTIYISQHLLLLPYKSDQIQTKTRSGW